jgi:hypothetical protein
MVGAGCPFGKFPSFLRAFTLIRPQGLGFLFTTAINQLVAQALVLPRNEPAGLHPYAAHVIQLWPCAREPLAWPPEAQLTEDELVRLSEFAAGFAVTMSDPPPRMPID